MSIRGASLLQINQNTPEVSLFFHHRISIFNMIKIDFLCYNGLDNAFSLRSLKFGGRLVVIGNVQPVPVDLPLGLIILKGNRIEGSISSTREDMKKALGLPVDMAIFPTGESAIDAGSMRSNDATMRIVSLSVVVNQGL